MNINGSQPMKQQVEDLLKGITQMTLYKPDKPVDLFQFYHPEVRMHFVDAYNLCRVWIQGLLYWKKIYPEEAFQEKTAYAKNVFVVRSKILRQYLDSFFQSLCQNFEFVDFVQIQLFELNEQGDKQFIQSERFSFSFSQKYANSDNLQQIKRKGLNTIQKQIEFKRFINEMQESFQKGFIRRVCQKVTFQLLMGYKWDHKSKNSKHRINLLNKWTDIGKQSQQGGQIMSHAGTDDFQVFCQRKIPTKGRNKIEVE